MDIIIAVLICIILLIGILRLLKAEDKLQQEQATELEKDELLYDPLTGRKITLEEAERGVNVDESEMMRIKSDDEIDEYYSDEERELEYMNRESLILNLNENEDERVFELLENAGIFSEVDLNNIQYLWQVSESEYIGAAYVSYGVMAGRSQSSHFENQLIGIVQGSAKRKQLLNIPALRFITIGETTLFRLAKKVSFEDFALLLGIMGVTVRDRMNPDRS